VKKYTVFSVVMEAATNKTEINNLAEFDDYSDAENYLAMVYQNNKMNTDIKDLFFDGKTVTLYNTSSGCYSQYKIKSNL